MNDQYILFQVAETTYALPAMQVQQIEMIENITRVPNAPHFVDGVVYVRGQVTPVLNLRRRFGLPALAYDLRARLLVVNVNGRVVGLAVDSAREFISIASQALQPPPDAIAGEVARFIQAIAHLNERLIFIIDLDHLLAVEVAALSD